MAGYISKKKIKPEKKPLAERQAEIRERIARGEEVTPREKALLNLDPMRTKKDITPENAREMQRKSVESRKARRSGQDVARAVLMMQAPDDIRDFLGLDENATMYDAICARMAREAATAGNSRAAVFMRDTAGDMPTAKSEVEIGMTDADRALMAKIQERLTNSNLSS